MTNNSKLKHLITVGVDDLKHGRYQTYNDSNLMQLADEISQRGRIRLNALRLKVAAKVHGKK
jgi:hypothetical protein